MKSKIEKRKLNFVSKIMKIDLREGFQKRKRIFKDIVLIYLDPLPPPPN